jgi:hypothetical protein
VSAQTCRSKHFSRGMIRVTCSAQRLVAIFVRTRSLQWSVNGNPFDELVEEIRRVVREELRAGSKGLHGGPSGFMDTKTAAAFLSTSEPALRALCKRGQVPVHRTPQGRLLFDPDELNAYVRGEAA